MSSFLKNYKAELGPITSSEVLAPIILETHAGIEVLRDDLLPGGTKSVLMPNVVDDEHSEYVYASPVYGAFQIALSLYCEAHGKRATIFCAKRNIKHAHTVLCQIHGATVHEVAGGYLSVCEKRARDYAAEKGAVKIPFGGHNVLNKGTLSLRCIAVIRELGYEPDEIWCAVGSGLLLESILEATRNATVYGIVVGRDSFRFSHPRATILRYPKAFSTESKTPRLFPSMPNYDLKAWELCLQLHAPNSRVLFWNVY